MVSTDDGRPMVVAALSPPGQFYPLVSRPWPVDPIAGLFRVGDRMIERRAMGTNPLGNPPYGGGGSSGLHDAMHVGRPK